MNKKKSLWNSYRNMQKSELLLRIEIELIEGKDTNLWTSFY